METMTAMLDSLRPADSARSAETTQHRRPTSKDILAGGYNCQREIPEPVECEFCGRKLYHEALVMGRTVLMFAPFPQRCTCDRAKAKWAEAASSPRRSRSRPMKRKSTTQKTDSQRGQRDVLGPCTLAAARSPTGGVRPNEPETEALLHRLRGGGKRAPVQKRYHEARPYKAIGGPTWQH